MHVDCQSWWKKAGAWKVINGIKIAKDEIIQVFDIKTRTAKGSVL